MKIGIVGAGIAGLALANLLDPGRYEIQLIGSAESLEPIGAGFTLQLNGREVLRRIFQEDKSVREAALGSTIRPMVAMDLRGIIASQNFLADPFVSSGTCE